MVTTERLHLQVSLHNVRASEPGLWAGSDGCATNDDGTVAYTAARCLYLAAFWLVWKYCCKLAIQYNALYGGNQGVDPETADTYTFGVVASPMDDLTVSLDYWTIDLEDAINAISPLTIMTQCMENNNTALCSLINRGNARYFMARNFWLCI